VLQGEVGDCWFIGALSIIGGYDYFVRGDFNPTPDNLMEITDEEAMGMTKGLYPPMFHYLRKYGIYVIRFFKNYAWRYVIIDDRLPCYGADTEEPQLVFAKCKDRREYWVPLIEKAYAKLHHCYMALISGFIDDGLNDMTGLVSEKLRLKNKQGQFSIDKEMFWDVLVENRKNNTLMGCSITGQEIEHEVTIDGEKTGLLANHAYSILDVIQLPDGGDQKGIRLLRIRNPWGNTEWEGRWSDGSPELVQHLDVIKEYIKKTAAENPEYEIWDPIADDGTFLMQYRDWR
jgi:hypothetical protein